MLKKALLLATIAAAISLFVVYGIRSQSRRSRNAPPPPQPDVISLSTFAQRLTVPDQDARGRIAAVSDAIAAGTLKAGDVDGVPVGAEVIPAWWLQRDDVYEIIVFFLGQEHSDRDITLITPDGRSNRLAPYDHKTTPTIDRVWIHRCHFYVDAQWRPASPGPSNVEDKDNDEIRKRFKQMRALRALPAIAVGDQRIGIVMGEAPAMTVSE